MSEKHTWDFGGNAPSGIVFDFDQSFDEQIGKLKSKNGGAFKRGGHNYFVLRALFAGHTVDDYRQRPLGANGMPINNVRTRVAQLRNDWNIVIGSRHSPDGNYKEYILKGRE